MDDLTNGIKEAQEQCVRLPRQVSTPGNIHRAHSVKPNMIKTDSQLSIQQKKAQTCASPPMEEVDGERLAREQFAREQFTSMSSLGSTNEHRDSDVNSLSESMNSSSVFSCSVTSLPVASGVRHSYHPASISDYLEGHLSPTPIPELPESPSIPRSVTPHFYATYSPRARSRSNSSFSSVITHSPRHLLYSQASPSQLSLSRGSASHPGLLSPPEDPRPRSGTFSIFASPRLALKVTRSSQDVRGRSSSPAHKKKNLPPKLSHSPKDQQLSYFRKNSLTDDSSFKESRLSITDDECELRGSSDNLSEGSSATENDTPTKTSARVLRRSSLTGQIEHVTNLRTQVRRNSSFNASAVEKLKHMSQRSLSIDQATASYSENTSTSSRKSSKVVFLESKETTV